MEEWNVLAPKGMFRRQSHAKAGISPLQSGVARLKIA